MLQPNIDYVICTNAAFVDSKAPLKMGKGVCVSTRNYFFYLPLQTVGTYPLIQTYKNHQYFQGVPVTEGIQKLIETAENVEDLEDSLSAILEDNPRNVHHIASYKNFNVSGLFAKNLFRVSNHRFNYYACLVKPKANALEFRKFHGI